MESTAGANAETDGKNAETDGKPQTQQQSQPATAAQELQRQLHNQKEAKKHSFTRSSDVSIASKKSKRHSKLSNNRNSYSSGNERGREKNSNGRLSIPFVQEEEKPLAIVKETSKDTKVMDDEHEPEIAKNVDDTPVKLPSGIHNNAILEIE